MKDKVIVRPRPIKHFKRKRTLYIPVDTPRGIIYDFIKKDIIEERNLGFGHIILLKDSTILFQSVGAPAAILSLERLVMSGTREIIILGFCGSLNSRYQYLNAAVITKARSEEGTSRHYLPRRSVFYPYPNLKKRIETILKEKGLSFYRGSLVSIDAPYRETTSWLRKQQSRGIDFVDMETSAVLALAEFYGIDAAALMIITDELASKKWKPGFKHPRLKNRIKEYFFPFLS